MKKRSLLSVSLLVLLSHNNSLMAYENLDEMMTRKQRLATAQWGYQFLENPAKNFTWQPESLCYIDTTTGKEVWVVTRQPFGQDIYSKEHGTNAWSADGSRIGFFDFSKRNTGNPQISSDRTIMRWLVNSDGSNLKAAEGYSKYDIPLGGFGWANTELAYYGFGSHALIDAPLYTLTKMTVDSNNVVAGKQILDTSSINTFQKGIVKEGISSTDYSILYRDTIPHRTNSVCESQATSEIYKTILDGTPQVDSHFGVSRSINGGYDHDYLTAEERFHDVWGLGQRHEKLLGDYSGSSSIFVALSTGSGSCDDGGPKYDPTNPSNHEVEIVSNGGDITLLQNSYNLPYFGHPTFDRWGRYIVSGTYTDNPLPGTRIIDTTNWSLLPNYVLAYKKYDGQHHSWGGWTDYVIGVDPVDMIIKQNKFFKDATDSENVVHTHHPGRLIYDYSGYPRPSQSPDGTKVAFAASWLNVDDDKYPYISFAVANYPHPPEITSVIGQAGTYSIRFDWRLDTNAPRGYTQRGWPDESINSPPPPRETRLFRLWRSQDVSNWMPIKVVAANIFERYNFSDGQWKGDNYWDVTDAPPTEGVYYYALTAIEHSGLESGSLSNVYNTNGIETETYPSYPSKKIAFWTTPPPKPTSVEVLPQSVPGHYKLSWTEPSSTLIRYYNIYYSTEGQPVPEARFRIASVPRGTSSWLDWIADPERIGYYLITSVDTQGNESLTAGIPKILKIK